MPVPIFCCFWFQKSYTRNILGNRRDKNQKCYICRDNTEEREVVEDTQQGGHTYARRGLALATPGAGGATLATASTGKPKTPEHNSTKSSDTTAIFNPSSGGF